MLSRLVNRFRRARPLFELPERLEKPGGTKAIVVAPHPDDETLGCGGTLAKHHAAGDRITAIFLTDGGRGDSLAGGVHGEALVELRESEARAAAAALGISDCIFLRNADASLQCSARTAKQLRAILDSLQPDLVYAPSPFESHRDHREACAIVARALSDYRRPVQVYLYEIWSPLPANCVVPIDLERKLRGVRMYRSQMDARELYVSSVTSLARYRAISCFPGEEGAVECFLRMDRGAFLELMQGGA